MKKSLFSILLTNCINGNLKNANLDPFKSTKPCSKSNTYSVNNLLTPDTTISDISFPNNYYDTSSRVRLNHDDEISIDSTNYLPYFQTGINRGKSKTSKIVDDYDAIEIPYFKLFPKNTDIRVIKAVIYNSMKSYRKIEEVIDKDDFMEVNILHNVQEIQENPSYSDLLIRNWRRDILLDLREDERSI